MSALMHGGRIPREICNELRHAGYQLVRRLGEGGMGELWAAARLGAQGAVKPCVLKTILPRLAHDARCRRLLMEEGRVGMLLRHANLVSAFDLFVVDDRPFLAMDWVDGVDLATLWARVGRRTGGALEVADAVHVAGALLDVLSYLHELGVVHHDVNPRNVMISARGEVVLMDLGLVGLAEVSKGEGPGFRGTLRYLAREQARGRPAPASDLFGVGAILHELLDGRRFRHACTTDEALRAEILLGGIPELERRVPEPVESLRRGLLEPRVALRIGSAAHAQERLLAWPGYRPRRARLEAIYREAIGPPRCRSAWPSGDRLVGLWRCMEPWSRADPVDESSTAQTRAYGRGSIIFTR